MIKLLIVFTLIPLLELWLLIRAGQIIGVLPTLLLVALTGFIGVALARSQGFAVMRQTFFELEQGHLPGEQLLDGACILVGGALLLTPGFVTDTLGFLLLIPASRFFLKGLIKRVLRRMLEEGTLLFLWRR